MEESLISLQVPHWLETLHAFLAPMEELLNHLPLVSDWLGASVLYLPPMEELLDHQQHSAASVILAAILTTLTLAQVSRWLETSGVYNSYDESLFKGTTALLHAIYALFSWSTLQGLFPKNQTDRERDRRLLDNCANNDLPPLRRSNSTSRRVDSPRARLRRFKDQWKDKSFPGSSRPPWIREQRLAWERNVCTLYMEALVRDHDALEGQLEERDASLESLRGQMAELELRVEQNRNWYCKIWNMHKPGDVVSKAPMSMAKMALRQTDLWEAMYRQNLMRMGDELQTVSLQLDKMTDSERALKKKITGFANEREAHRQERERDQALIEKLRRELEDSLKEGQVEGQDEKRVEDIKTEENLEGEEADERQIAASAGMMKHKTSKESINLVSKQLSEELVDTDINDDDMIISWE
ncbi:unnamed protein product [Clonostachys chloroleuca]|uniref:Uncharacterized protein n=1 Tax=Clonostachys chloroleuca TaxID=1926264 RepID=A0AA35Q099_9HYPO|nr:unnamed protein product [Clonostachys chloroleuca]